MKVNNLYIQDTIVASASAAGIGGINIIRLSGVHTEKIIKIILSKIEEKKITKQDNASLIIIDINRANIIKKSNIFNLFTKNLNFYKN